MKTAVSLPDELFRRADRLARRLKRPRSRLYSDALREYVARHDAEVVTTSLDEIVGAVRPRKDKFLTEAARRALENVDW